MAIALLTDTTPTTTGSYNNGSIDVPAKQTDVVVVDQDNVMSALIESGYYEESEFTFPE